MGFIAELNENCDFFAFEPRELSEVVELVRLVYHPKVNTQDTFALVSNDGKKY